MELRGSLATVEKVSARRPLILMAATICEALAAVRACQAIDRHAPMAWHTVTWSNTIPDGIADVGLWLVWTLAVAAWLFITPGRFKFTAADRRRLDDELVAHHRSAAIRAAFLVLALAVTAMALAGAGGHSVAWWPVAALTAALCAGSLMFAGQELRADA